MSAWSELSGNHRVSCLVQQPKRLPPERCDLCGVKVPSVEEHKRDWCAVLARYGLVYYIQAGPGGPIKIGFTQQPVDRRLMQIRPSTPFGLRLLLTIAGTRETEKRQHREWKRWRLRGEWFEATPVLVEAIARVQHDTTVAKDKELFRVAHLDRLRFVLLADTARSA